MLKVVVNAPYRETNINEDHVTCTFENEHHNVPLLQIGIENIFTPYYQTMFSTHGLYNLG